LKVTLLKDKLTDGVEVSLLKVKFIKDHFYLIVCAEQAFSNGLMDDFIMDHFKEGKNWVRVFICGLTVKSMMENLKMMIAMDLEFCITQMENDLRVLGKTVKRTERECMFGQMEQSTIVYMRMVRRRIRVNLKAQASHLSS